MGDYFDSTIFLAEWQPFYMVLKYTSQNLRLYIHCQRMLPYQLLLRYQDCFCSILRISSANSGDLVFNYERALLDGHPTLFLTATTYFQPSLSFVLVIVRKLVPHTERRLFPDG